MSGIKVLSLFSGLGGLDLGLEAAGFQSVGCVELDELARRSLKANRGDHWPILDPADVRLFAEKVTPRSLGLDPGELDLLAAAPPCQPFSKAAQWNSQSRRGIDDERGNLIFSVIDVIARFKPKLVVLENVRGYVQGPESILPLLRTAVGEIGRSKSLRYELEHRLLDAHGYGVPQRRDRAIIVLSRIGRVEWPRLLPAEARPVAWDALHDVACQLDAIPCPTGKWAELLPSIPEGSNYLHHTDRGLGQPLFGYRTRYWSFLLKLAKDQPASTLAAQPGPSTGPFHWTSRPLAIEEMLRLQSFPADWRVEGTRREQVRQIGNATPPALAEAVGRSLVQLLGQEAREPFYAVRRQSVPIPPSEIVKAVPKKYETLIGVHDAHPGTGLGPSPRT